MIFAGTIEKIKRHQKVISKISFYLLIGFFIFYIASRTNVLLNQSMWFDEIQAWNIAKHSDNLYELYENLQYEAHPPLWHLLIYPITKVSDDPNILKPLNMILMALAVGLFVFMSPFSKLEKILFMFGYVPFFEFLYYSRTYSLFLLLAFLGTYFYIKFDKTKLNKYFLLSLLCLSLLSATHIIGAIFTFSIGLMLFFSKLKKEMHIKDVLKDRNLLLAILMLVSSAGIIYNTLLLPIDFNFPIWQIYDYYSIDRLLDTFVIFFGSIFTELFAEGKILGPRVVYAVLTIYFFITNTITFRRNKALLWSYIIGSLGFFTFLYIEQVEIRHIKLLFVFTLCCFWIYRSSPNLKGLGENKLYQLNVLLTISILALQAVHGVSIENSNKYFKTSNTEKVAQFISMEGYQDLPLLCEDVGPCLSVAGYLNKTPWLVWGRDYKNFVVWNNKFIGSPSKKKTIAAIYYFREKEGLADDEPLILLMKSGRDELDENTKRIASFADITLKEENLYVYINVID